MNKRDVLLVIGATFVGDIVLLLRNLIQPSDAVSLLLAAGLVVATLGLWQSTERYVKATNEIAKATSASVFEMQKQRYIGSQPWVFPKLINDDGEYADPTTLLFENVGNGPAIALKPFVSDGDVTRLRDEWKRETGPSGGRKTGPNWSTLKHGMTISWEMAFEVPRSGEAGVIAVEYRDIYGREILSGWAYRIEKVEKERLALIPGEPLFPVER